MSVADRNIPSRSWRSPSELSARLFWLAMFLLHVPGLLASLEALLTGSTSDLFLAGLRVVGLSLSAGFFLLKMADVRWLRLKPGWRSFVAALIATAVLHVGVLERAVDSELACSPAHAGVVLFVGAVGQAARLVNRLQALQDALPRSSARKPALEACRQHLVQYTLPLPLIACVPSYSGPRAPPHA